MTANRYSRMGAGFALSALLIGSIVVIAPMASAAERGGQGAVRVAAADKIIGAKIDGTDPAAGAAIEKDAAEGSPGCQRTRKRLWVDGEGWIVRRVTVCY